MYLQTKLAAAFRLLEDPQSSAITQEDWDLADMMMQCSRKCYEENLREYKNENLNRRADCKEEDELVREQVDIRALRATEKRIVELLESSAQESVSRTEISRSLSKRQKLFMDDALENLIASGVVKHSKGRRGGDWYSLI